MPEDLSESGEVEDPVLVMRESGAVEGKDLGSKPCELNAGSKVNVLPRKFLFAEFFAGWGGFSSALDVLAEQLVTVAAALDGYGGEWDILKEDDFKRAQNLCGEVDHGHFAPACCTLMRARSSDEPGTMQALRTDTYPEGWGHPEVMKTNDIVERVVSLCLYLHRRGSTFAVENPADSFIWLLPKMQKLLKLAESELVLLHQCAYGASTMQPTCVLTTAAWMKRVCALCAEVRGHIHAKSGLMGKIWDYTTGQLVWRTSLEAEYPCGLCVAWSRNLSEWLQEPAGWNWIRERTFIKVGHWKNVLIRMGADTPAGSQVIACQPGVERSVREKRDAENRDAWGGLRNPRFAVMRSPALRAVGKRIRAAIDKVSCDVQLDCLEKDIQGGVTDEWITSIRAQLAAEFHTSWTADGLQAPLWKSVLESAKDPDAQVLSEWLQNGFPLGISCEIAHTGVFPSTETDSASVEASRLEGYLTDDAHGSAVNYKSFEEAGQHAQKLLDKLHDEGRSDVFNTWREVCEAVGDNAKLTRLACVVKQKESGEVKYRLVIDSRRSGVNGLCKVRERVLLPKITDAVAALNRVRQGMDMQSDDELEMFSADFRDAFHTLPLRKEDRCYVICKDMHGKYHVSKVVLFGLAPGPLLWARLASAAMRVSQAAVQEHEASVVCYVDDPLMFIRGRAARQRLSTFLIYIAVWLSLGLTISWNKACRGLCLQWIGFELVLSGKANADLVVRMTQAKRHRLMELFAEIRSYKGVLPLKLLETATGILGWISSVMPLARPYLAMLWAVIVQQRRPLPRKANARERKGLVFVRQVDHAISWLETLTKETHLDSVGMQRHYRWRPFAPRILIQTDACPTGMGGFLMVGGQFKAYWHRALNESDARLFQATLGDPSFQSEWELLAVWISIEVFLPLLTLPECSPQIILRTDNTAVLSAAMEHRATSPIMVRLAAEISLQLEIFQLEPIIGQHVPGVLNRIADCLSRLHAQGTLPQELQHAEFVSPGSELKFRAWRTLR